MKEVQKVFTICDIYIYIYMCYSIYNVKIEFEMIKLFPHYRVWYSGFATQL